MKFKTHFPESQRTGIAGRKYTKRNSARPRIRRRHEDGRRSRSKTHPHHQEDFDENNINPNLLQEARQVLCSLITSCKGMAVEIVQSMGSPSEAWTILVRHHHASGLKERCHLTVEFHTTKMELEVKKKSNTKRKPRKKMHFVKNCILPSKRRKS